MQWASWIILSLRGLLFSTNSNFKNIKALVCCTTSFLDALSLEPLWISST
ncbi:hypothetical protein KC19_9G008400 [Ceratodon purpureus]|uniref:Uncharacterized protein n=1 Tax=Ceratodon purpureus TaxID=3225 RepID=A0A8T0GNY8_CERPU|nr:hypothetical protein KC19_9G008400 [Ceratodon purpureus]